MKNSLIFIKNFGEALIKYDWDQPMKYYSISILCIFILLLVFLVSKEHIFFSLMNAPLIVAIPGLLLEYYKYFEKNKEKFWFKVLTTGAISSFVGYILFNIIFEFSSSWAKNAIFYITGLDSSFFPHATRILTYLYLVPLSIETIVVALSIPIIIRMLIWFSISLLSTIFLELPLFFITLFFPENRVNTALKKLEKKITMTFGSILGVVGIIFIYMMISAPFNFQSSFLSIVSVIVLANTDYHENEYYKGKYCSNLSSSDMFVVLKNNTISVLRSGRGWSYEFEVMQCENSNSLISEK